MTASPTTGARRRSRILTAAAVFAAAPLVLAGCTADESDTPTDGSIGGTITYWAGLNEINDQSIAEVTDNYVTPFEKEYPDVTADFIPQNREGLQAKIQTALAAGLGPDLIETPGSSVAIPYSEAGYLLDLADLADEEGWADELLPWALDTGYIDGELTALPLSYESLVTYYNKTLFAEHGWEVPTDADSFYALVDEMLAAGVTPFAAGNADYQGATEWLVSAYLNQIAGASTFHDALAGDISFTDQAFVDALQELVDQVQAGWFGGGVEQYFSTTDPQKYAQLVNGEAGMFLSGSWEIYTLNEYFDGSGSEWGWFALPPLADGVSSDVYPLSVGGTLSINAATDNPEAAKAYLRWKFSDTESNWESVAAIGIQPLPVRFDPADLPDGIDERFVEQYSAITEASVAENVGYVTWTSLGGAAESYLLANEDKLFTGDLTVEQFLQGLADAYDEDAADGVIPPLFGTKAR